MATLKQIYNIRYGSGELRARVIGAMLLLANTETKGNNKNKANAASRSKWAKNALKNPEAYADAFLLACALDDKVAQAGDAASDADIIAAVESSIDLLVDE